MLVGYLLLLFIAGNNELVEQRLMAVCRLLIHSSSYVEGLSLFFFSLSLTMSAVIFFFKGKSTKVTAI